MKITFTAEVENEYEAEKLKRRFEMLTDPDWVAIWWGIEDVYEMRPDLDSNQAQKVLQVLEHDHDASIGANWETIEDIAQELYGEAPEEEEV